MQCCDIYGKEQTLQCIPKLNKTQQHKMQESSWNHQEMQIQPFYTQFTPKTRLLLSFTLVSYSFFSSGLKRNTHTMLLLPLSNQKWWVLICMRVFSLDAQHAGARRQFPSSVLVSMGTFLLAPFPPIQSIIIPNTDWFYAESDGGVRPSQYFWYDISNISLHCSWAFNREQMRNEPPILRWSEYVSSGGGVSRCLSITGMRLWILSVVDWEPKSKGSEEAKASPRIITASTWAFTIAWTTHVKKQKTKEQKNLINQNTCLTHYVCALLQLSFTCLWLLHSDKAIICKAEQAEKAQRSLPWTRNRSGTSSR